VISSEGFDAEPGSVEYGAIVAAIRAGRGQGYRQLDALQSGAALPRILRSDRKADKATALTPRDAVERYLKQKKMPAKTSSEVNLSLRTFETVIDNKSFDALTRSDFRSLVRHLAEQTVGGKSVDSVKRPMSAHAIEKRPFKSMLGLAESRPHPNIINEVMGHAKPALDQRYVGTIPIEEAYSAIRTCTYRVYLYHNIYDEIFAI
jgi:hypothetical protein